MWLNFEIAGLFSFFSEPLRTLQAGGSYSGGIGHAVAAYLQTKGMIDQATILSQFGPHMEWIAALGWLFAIGMALGSAAVFGSYRNSLYFLLGPPLFYYMVTTTVTTDGVQLRVGDDIVPGSKKEQNEMLTWIGAISSAEEGSTAGQGDINGDAIDGVKDGSVEVSFFFGIFDTVVTELTQKVVSVMLNANNRDHLRFVARERVRTWVLQAVPRDGAFSKLVSQYHFGECAETTTVYLSKDAAMKTVGREKRKQADIDEAVRRIKDDQWVKPKVNISKDVRIYLLAAEQASQAEGVAFHSVPFKSPEHDKLVSCEDVWFWVRDTVFSFSKKALTLDNLKASFKDDSSGIKWDEVYDDVKKWLAGSQNGEATEATDADAVKALSAFVYKNSITNANHAGLQNLAQNRAVFNAKEFETIWTSVFNAEAHGGFMQLRYFASSIPYIQGMLLYLLAVAFPFFAIFLVVPEKATAFLTWCSLWIWVKSWDVGFAGVHVARDVLWHLTRGWINNFDQRDVSWSDPSDVMTLAFNNDAALTENTYWLMISGLTLAVPVVSAHLCMGATELYDMARKGIDEMPKTFGRFETMGARRIPADKTERSIREHDHMMNRVKTRG